MTRHVVVFFFFLKQPHKYFWSVAEASEPIIQQRKIHTNKTKQRKIFHSFELHKMLPTKDLDQI